jgi:hypothetical protein
VPARLRSSRHGGVSSVQQTRQEQGKQSRVPARAEDSYPG